MHFKKILSASILASALIFCIPQAIYAAPDAKTETPVTYGWNSDTLGRFFLTENGSRATGFCSIDQKVYYFDPDGYLFTPSQEGVMYLAQKPYYFLADGSVKTGLFSINQKVVSPGIMPEPIISCLQTVPLPLAAKFTVSEPTENHFQRDFRL